MTAPKWRLESPHTYNERILLMGGGGTGKSTAVVRLAEAIPTAEFYVVDNDISSAYDRLMSSYQWVTNINVYPIMPGWEDYIATVKEIVSEHNCPAGLPVHERPWLAIDSATPSWDDVQSFYIDSVMGSEIGSAMIELRKGAKNQKEYMAALGDLMQWPTINKIYATFYNELRKWRGNFVLTTEVAETGRNDKEEVSSIFGFLGVKPKGQGRLHHVASTNLLLTVTGRDTWRMTAAKDRERQKCERVVFDNFALDYLVEVAEWNQVPR